MRKISICLALLLLSGGLVFAGGKKEPRPQKPPEAKKESPAPTPAPVPPEWVSAMDGVETVYPNAQYIAQRGMGKTQAEAEVTALAAISRYFSTQIQTSMREVASVSGQTGLTNSQLDEETFARSQTDLFAVRYAPDPWHNTAEGQWETVAYIDRDEAWTIYGPQVRQRANAFAKLFEAAENDTEPFRQFFQYPKVQAYAEQELDSYFRFAEILNPREMQNFAAVIDAISSIPQRREQARLEAGIFVECPLDLDGLVATALTQVISAEGFPVTQNRASASAVCTASVDDGLQNLQAGTFYTPAVRVTISGKLSGAPLFSCTIRTPERSGAVNPDVAKRRGYTALAEEILKSFHGEFVATSGN